MKHSRQKKNLVVTIENASMLVYNHDGRMCELQARFQLVPMLRVGTRGSDALRRWSDREFKTTRSVSAKHSHAERGNE